MTQIKLRRDTSAAFASSNPILGNGEPAYETDTKKLKIGDGTTAYTQLEYFSAGGGGGGTTDITATLPLKIVDGVISLEVDGQTIQIVDGKLHANLDELGNEVNSLTGEVTDLSGRVTAAEADILTKENKITATGALSLQEKIISNLTNMTETETQITPNTTQYFTVDQSEFYFTSPIYNAPQCYIAIPYQFGQWLKIPSGYSIQPSVFFGHFLKDGDFLITAVFNGSYYDTSAPIYGGIVKGRAPVSFSTYSGKLYLNNYKQVSEKAMAYDIKFTETDPCAYLQLIDNTASNNIICGSYNYGYGPNGNGVQGYAETHVVYNRDLTNYTVQDFVRDTTTALIMSPSANYPILKSAVGLYAATGRLGWNQNGYNQLKANLGENLFDLTKSQVNNYLELNTDSSLVVNSEGKLGLSSPTPTKTSDLTNDSGFITAIPTASADTLGGIKVGNNLSITEDGTLSATGGGSAPTNMVTTDTAQTITGHKTFDKIILPTGSSTKGIYIEGKTHPSINANYGTLSFMDVGMFMCSSLIVDNGDNNVITLGQYPETGYSAIKFTGYNGPSTAIFNGLRYDTTLKTISLGDDTLSTKIKGSSVVDKDNNKFLTGGDVTAYVIEEFVDGTEGYRVWSNGRCEQWGSFTGGKSITFLKNYVDTNYTLLAYVVSKTSNEAYNGVFGTTKTTTGFSASGFAGTTNDAWIITTVGVCNWYTSGVLAS